MFTWMIRKFRSLIRNDDGALLAEYVLLVTMIALACILAVTSFGGNVQSLFTNGTGSI